MFESVNKKGRIVLVDVAKDVFSDIEVAFPSKKSVKTLVAGSDPAEYFHTVRKSPGSDLDNSAYNFPFLFLADGRPWVEANSYLLDLLNHTHYRNRPTDLARSHASKLLDYKIFCEENGINWLDFSGRRASQRPTYKYFHHLAYSSGRSNAVINQYTGVVYAFYKHVALYFHDIDIDRVDTVKTIKILVGQSYLIDAEKRSQTKRVPPPASVEVGFVRENGEDLRPLVGAEYTEFIEILQGKQWSAIERLIFYVGLLTGARKQSVLTLRMKHLKLFVKNKIKADGSYTVHAGPGTGIDTKFDKPQVLHFPDFLADSLLIYANSEVAASRRDKFKEVYKNTYPHLEPISDDDMYVFLSEQGGCYYAAEDDPRYPFMKTKPIGQVTSTLVRKLLKFVSPSFPKSFDYHWTRATFALQYYHHLKKAVNEKLITYTDQISMIQKRLHHESRTMTEHYLKLFTSLPEKEVAQDLFEEAVFKAEDIFGSKV